MKYDQKKVELIITDVGGVLIKTDEAIFECIERVAKEKSIYGGSVEAIKDVLGTSIKDYIGAYLPEKHKDQTHELHEDFKIIYPFKVKDLLEPFEGVDTTLKHMKGQGIRLAVLSCMRREAVETILEQLSFQEFDEGYSIEDYGEAHKRPDPKGLLKLISVFEEKPERTLYVGDTDSDIQMAKNAGVISVAVRTGAQPNIYLEKAKPDYLIDSFCDIPTKVLQSFV